MVTEGDDAVSDPAPAPEARKSGNVYQSDRYLTAGRFLTFYEQIRALRCLPEVSTVAEIGAGSGTTAAVLRNTGYEVTTIDFDANLKPDILCSILEMETNLAQKFDVVACFQVLEHLPYTDFQLALRNMVSIARKHVIISLPYSGYAVRLSLLISTTSGERQVNLAYRLPPFWRRHVYDGQHYWVVGKQGFSLGRITKAIGEQLHVRHRWLFPYNRSQVFFVCDVPEAEQAKRQQAAS